MPPTTLLHITTIPMSLVFLRGQVGYMQSRGLRIFALSSPGAELHDFAAREGVEVHAVEMPRRITPFRDLKAISGILRYMHRVRPTIVHAHTPKGGLLGMIAAWLYRAPVRVYHMRGLPLTDASGLKRRLLWLSEWLACRLADQVICVSHSVRGEALAAGVCPAGKIRVFLGGSGNGVDGRDRFNPELHGFEARHAARERFGIPPEAVVIGFVGRIVRDKGLVELAAAWQELRQRFSHVHLLLVGPFEPQDPLPADVEAMLRSDPRIHVAGEDWNTPPLYAAMDLAVLPTYREGFPNVPLEAAAMGLPVVATRIPGCVDAVAHGETGMLVPPRDAASLAAALSAYIEDAPLRSRHGTVGRERALRDFRPEGIWAAIHDEYERLLQLKGLAPAERSAPAAARAS
jgi:glycosyltransferase involved in cell wall biosynthesis